SGSGPPWRAPIDAETRIGKASAGLELARDAHAPSSRCVRDRRSEFAPCIVGPLRPRSAAMVARSADPLGFPGVAQPSRAPDELTMAGSPPRHVEFSLLRI